MKKERLDKYLVDLGYFENKSKASAAILAGDVLINDERITKAGFQIRIEKEYDIRIKSMPYVSRGGFKLEKALKTLPEHRPADLQTAYFKTELNLFMLLMWVTVSWIGKSEAMTKLKPLKKQI